MYLQRVLLLQFVVHQHTTKCELLKLIKSHTEFIPAMYIFNGHIWLKALWRGKVLIKICVLICWQDIKDRGVMNAVFGSSRLSCLCASWRSPASFPGIQYTQSIYNMQSIIHTYHLTRATVTLKMDTQIDQHE